MTDIIVNREAVFREIKRARDSHEVVVRSEAPVSTGYWEGYFDAMCLILGLPLDSLTNRRTGTPPRHITLMR